MKAQKSTVSDAGMSPNHIIHERSPRRNALTDRMNAATAAASTMTTSANPTTIPVTWFVSVVTNVRPTAAYMPIMNGVNKTDTPNRNAQTAVLVFGRSRNVLMTVVT